MFNNFLLDGMDNNAYGESNQGFDNQIIAVPPDSVAQFQVVTNNESAEYGRSSGATINVASQSGTNRFHATAYEFIRNTDLNAAGFFKPTDRSAAPATPFPSKSQPSIATSSASTSAAPSSRTSCSSSSTTKASARCSSRSMFHAADAERAQRHPGRAGQEPDHRRRSYPARTTAIPSGAINPLSAQIISYFKQIAGLPVCRPRQPRAWPPTTTPTGSFHRQRRQGRPAPRLADQSPATRFLRISDRKENGVNYPVIPFPLDGQTNGNIRILDQQIALGYTHLFGANKVLDARLGLDRTKAGKFNLSIGNTAFTTSPACPRINAVVAGGLPSIGITGFTGFGRQSTNPQWQNPALIDPKVNFTWVKGNHSLKFGYEYEHVWMAVNDNNPLYGSFTYGGGYSTPTARIGSRRVSDNYWADFLFGTTNAYSLANYFVAHLRQNIHNLYAQDDWKVMPNLTLNLGLRWEYGSPYSELYNYISNFDPARRPSLPPRPEPSPATASRPFQGGGIYGKTLVNPDFTDFGPRVGFAYAVDSKTALRGGFGISYVALHPRRLGRYSRHQCAAGAVRLRHADHPERPRTTAPRRCPRRSSPIGVDDAVAAIATSDQGYPERPGHQLQPGHRQHHLHSQRTPRTAMSRATSSASSAAWPRTPCSTSLMSATTASSCRASSTPTRRTPAAGFARPYANWPSDITEALNEFYSNFNSLQVKYEQRFVGGLTLLNTFTWEHSLDNASASLEGNTPSPQDGNNIPRGLCAVGLQPAHRQHHQPRLRTPFGHGRRFLGSSNGAVNTLVGGWQVSGIITMQAGTPFNITYGPNSAQAVSPQISATYRGANEYRPNKVPGQSVTQGRNNRAANTGYVNYINFNAFVLPPIKDAAGNTA